MLLWKHLLTPHAFDVIRHSCVDCLKFVQSNNKQSFDAGVCWPHPTQHCVLVLLSLMAELRKQPHLLRSSVYPTHSVDSKEPFDFFYPSKIYCIVPVCRMKCRTAETYLPDSVFGFLFSCFLAYPRPTSFVFVYTQQQGIPQNTAGDPSHYYTSKSGYSLPRQQHITHALAVNGPTGWYSANMQMKSPQSHGEGKKEGKERKAPPLCNKLQLRASAAGRESALEK